VKRRAQRPRPVTRPAQKRSDSAVVKSEGAVSDDIEVAMNVEGHHLVVVTGIHDGCRVN
jgi:hypothetical protein